MFVVLALFSNKSFLYCYFSLLLICIGSWVLMLIGVECHKREPFSLRKTITPILSFPYLSKLWLRFRNHHSLTIHKTSEWVNGIGNLGSHKPKSKSFGGFPMVAQWWWLREVRWRNESWSWLLAGVWRAQVHRKI